MTQNREDKKPWPVIAACIVMTLFILYFLTPGFIIGLVLRTTQSMNAAEKVMVVYKPVEWLADKWDIYSLLLQKEVRTVISSKEIIDIHRRATSP